MWRTSTNDLSRVFLLRFFLAHSRIERAEKGEREREGGEGRTKRRKDRDGNKGMSGRESGGSRPESTQP